MDRLRYAPLGWSKYYEFSSSDLRCSLNCVDAWIDRASNGPSGSKSASRSVLASTLKRQVHPGSPYRCGRST